MLSLKNILLLGLFAASALSTSAARDHGPHKLHKRIVPGEWYVCGDTNRPGNDAVVSYTRADVENAILAAFVQIHAEVPVHLVSSHNNRYPHQFFGSSRDPRYRNLDRRCREAALQEFPLVHGGVFTSNTDEGLDRVIFDAWSGAFCGVMTHRGNIQGRNDLWPCWSHNEPVFEPKPALPRLDPNGNGGGFGTGGLPWVNIFGGSENLQAKMRERNAEALPQAPPPSVSAANAAAPLSSCSLVVTTITGSILPGPTSYCACAGGVVAGINVEVTSSTIYSVCAGAPFPTMATATALPDSTPPAEAIESNPECSVAAPCNAGTCKGLNTAYNATFGVCQEGDCTGYLCTNTCGSQPAQCADSQCNGLVNTIGDTIGICTAGDLAGCDCTPSCAGAQPCSDCLGTSYNNGTGLCGPGPSAGCTCTATCPSSPVACNSQDCGGINDPHGGMGICLTGSLRGCSCNPVCQANGPCNDAGCNGWNSATGAGSCTSGDFFGCTCTSLCGQIQGQTCASISSCAAILSSNGPGTCTSGDYRGCPCDSQCPSNPLPSCTDDSCQGTDGFCGEEGSLIGCTCTK